jgi:tetratricopeptide (TPR) repeat protein
MRQFDRAIAYFNKVLTNDFYHKDQDAQIKKGYAYFMQKKFDLAAREFQRYIREFPNGKYVAVAKEWKNMSTAELQNIIESKKAESEGYIEEELKQKPQPQKNNTNENDLGLEEDEEVVGSVSQDFNDVNVAEF